MSPEERQLLQGLFDRMRNSGSAPRDRDAEQMIADQVRQQPYSPYLLAQTVIIQDQALQAANDRLQQLERQVQEHQAQGQQGGSSGGFLSGLFGGGGSSPSRSSVPTTTQQRPSWNQGGTGFPPPPPQNVPQQYAPPPQQGGGPWAGGGGGGWGQQQPGGGGGFLKGALGTAAGVAGGVLMADGIRSLFSSGHAGGGLGIGAGVPGVGGGSVTNNYYGDSASSGALSDADRTQDSMQDEQLFNQNNNNSGAADWQQDADQDQDMAQDAEWGDDDFS